jgi:hypothetical protein
MMNKKHLLQSTIIALSVLTLSACTLKDQLKTKILNKIDQKVQEEKAEAKPTLTDDELLKEIDATSSTDIDAQFNQLENDIK